MKLLLDTCVWGGAAKVLREVGHDVVWAGNWDKDPGDTEILSASEREGRILVTLDKDFGELAVVFRTPHAGILRLVNFSARQQGPGIARSRARTRGIITAEPGRLRIRASEDSR